jgi:hypothetical protein
MVLTFVGAHRVFGFSKLFRGQRLSEFLLLGGILSFFSRTSYLSLRFVFLSSRSSYLSFDVSFVLSAPHSVPTYTISHQLGWRGNDELTLCSFVAAKPTRSSVFLGRSSIRVVIPHELKNFKLRCHSLAFKLS